MKNYEFLLNLKVFTFAEMCELVGNINTANSMIKNMLKKKYIKRVTQGLYVVCDIERHEPLASQYMIASKIRNDASIAYHSALEFYGAKNQVFYDVYVLTSKKFDEFEFEGYRYISVNNKIDFGMALNNKVVTTDKERTLIDCIDKCELAGGLEELFLCLELMTDINGERVLNYLSRYNSKKLYAKVGFILDTFKEVWNISEKVLLECQSNICNTKYYFDHETKRVEHSYIKRWNLIVPNIFLNRGGNIYW